METCSTKPFLFLHRVKLNRS